MVSLDVAPPVVKSVELTEPVHDPSSAPRASVTLVVPSCEETVALPVAALPNALDAGAEIESAPPVRVNVVVVSAAPAGVARPTKAAVAIVAVAAIAATVERIFIVPPAVVGNVSRSSAEGASH
jgi:hypothetical protein